MSWLSNHVTSHMKMVLQSVKKTEARLYAHRKMTAISFLPAPNNWVMVPDQITKVRVEEKHEEPQCSSDEQWIWHGLPMFIAGGTAYCKNRMNWYRGSGCTRPRLIAHLTIPTPIMGRIIKRTTKTPITRELRMSDPCRPGKSTAKSHLVVNQMRKSDKEMGCQRREKAPSCHLWWGFLPWSVWRMESIPRCTPGRRKKERKGKREVRWNKCLEWMHIDEGIFWRFS